MPTAAERDKAKKGIKARNDALNTLIDRHREEFDTLVVENRKALGLTARPAGPTADQIEKKIARAQEQLEKWQRELEEAT